MQFSCNKLNVIEFGCGCFRSGESRNASNCMKYWAIRVLETSTERPVIEMPREKAFVNVRRNDCRAR